MLQKPCFMSLEVFRVNRIRMGEKVADSQKINTDRIIRSSFAEQKVLKKGNVINLKAEDIYSEMD